METGGGGGLGDIITIYIHNTNLEGERRERRFEGSRTLSAPKALQDCGAANIKHCYFLLLGGIFLAALRGGVRQDHLRKSPAAGKRVKGS